MAYPLWVRALIVSLLSICVLLLVIFKPTIDKPSSSPPATSAVMNIGTLQGGHVAGHDVIVNSGPVGAQTAELIRVLQARAARIHQELAPHYKDIEVQRFLNQFQALHVAHIAALERNNLIEAHEYLSQIQKVSRELEFSAFFERQHFDVSYHVSSEKFQRGKLIEWYAGKVAMEALVQEALSGATVRAVPQTADLYVQITK